MAPEKDEFIFRSRFQSVTVPENVTLPEFVLQGAEAFADKTAFVEIDGKGYTYAEVCRDVKSFAKALRSLGLRKGTVVLVILPNVAEYGIIALGIMTAGGVFSGVNPASHVSEIQKQADSSDAKILITDELGHEKVKHMGLPVIIVSDKQVEGAVNWRKLIEAGEQAGDGLDVEEVHSTDLCALPFSSGTTGLSKGVMLTHNNLVANLCSTLFSVGPELVGQVTTLGLIPFFHIYGITGICCATLRNKGKVVVMSKFELRSFLDAMIKHEVSFAPIVPPIILNLVKNPIVNEYDLSKLKLRAIMSAAAPLAPDILAAFEKKFPGVEVQEAYGLTEHSCITLTHGDPTKLFGSGVKKNSVGFILPNLELKFIDPETGKSLPEDTPGEVCVRSQCVMKGYYKNKEATENTIDEEGWLHTGDIGYIDKDGDVFIVDRIKELIKYKGFQVAPAELEAILLSHPSIEDAAVVPLPDEEAGEIPAACVVLNKNAKESEQDIINYVASNVAHYKKVRVVRIVESIPTSPSGKVMRRVVKERMIEKMKK